MAVLPKWALNNQLGFNDPLVDHLATVSCHFGISIISEVTRLGVGGGALETQFAQMANSGRLDPFAKISKAIAGGFGKIVPSPTDFPSLITKKQYKVPKGTTITIPRPNATMPIDKQDIRAGEMIISRKEAVYDEDELVFNDDGYYAFKLPWNNKEIPYIIVDHKRTMVLYIIELPGDLSEEIF